MMKAIVTALLYGLILLSIGWMVHASEPEATSSAELDLSPGVLELLRAEMREIAGGMQVIVAALPIGGWQSIHDTGQRIHDSYIMNQQLTDAQARELEQALPPLFVTLDQALHSRALKLAEAAHEQDAEQVAFHFSRMLETCTDCHAAFAASRFPALKRAEEPMHHH